MWAVGDRVEYPGPDDVDLMLYRGHPGYVWAVSESSSVYLVGFVKGPSLDCSSLDGWRRLEVAEYVRRGRRLVEHQHPLHDRTVPTLLRPGDERHDPNGEPSIE